MATTSQRSVKRNADKVAPKSNTRSNVAPVTQETVRNDFKEFLSLESKAWNAKAILRRHVLQLTIADAELAIEWRQRWDTWNSDTKGKTATAARASAKAYFQNWFGIVTSSDSKSNIAKAAVSATKPMREIVQECVAVYKLGDGAKVPFGSGFDFDPDGSTYITRDSDLGRNMWAHMEYDKDDNLMGEGYQKRNPAMIVLPRSDQVHPGQVAWSDVRAMLLDKTGQQRTGTAAAKENKMEAKSPLAGLKFFADTAKGNAAAYQTKENKLAALDSVTAILVVAFNGPLFAPGWESVNKGFDMLRKAVGSQPTPGPATKSLADAKGADVLQLFKRTADLKTPEAAKVLPHPKGQAAKAARANKK